MSIKFYSKDLPAARAYVANQLSSCGYDDEADIIRKDAGFTLDTSAFVRSITNAAGKLMALWVPVTGSKVPSSRMPATKAHSL